MAQMTPLRRRMIDDMTVRNLSPATQQSYVYAVAKFSRFFGCSPDRLGIEEVRAYQLHLAGLGWSWSHINQVSCALRFFFGVTLGRPEAFDRIISAKEPKKLPVVLSGEEIVRFLQAVPGLRNRTALTTAYGAGLRVCEVAALKVGDIDSSRMVIRVDTARAARTATSCCRPNSCASFGPTGDWLSRLPGCFLVVTGIGRSAFQGGRCPPQNRFHEGMAAEPRGIVRRLDRGSQVRIGLAAGGSRIRTPGPTCDGIAVKRMNRAGDP
jgi:hypothetical protein